MKRILLLIVVLLFNETIFAQINKPINVDQDSTLKMNLESIRTKDQTLRLIIPELENRFGKDSDELTYIWTLIHFQDSINETDVISIIDKYGWLGTNRIGELANQTLWLVIQHAPIYIQEKYIPFLRISVEKGESEGWYLAFLEDRIAMRNGENQIYGTQSKYNKTTEKYHIYPIQNPENVNERRKRIGLETIEEYAKENGYIIDKNEK
ncbi:MAG: hypothetical protein CVT92_17140 [Bacteroidetes bacterium HGW-Bacteroidetes-1]|jgi:hypothetical protein|nr:MAG: hypothetical protein CVT92_17140 [Bacteroidetes bacterium HGW-Bacteroidetes-1]